MRCSRVAFWRWPRFTMAARAAMLPGSAVSTLQIVRDWMMRSGVRLRSSEPGPLRRRDERSPCRAVRVLSHRSAIPKRHRQWLLVFRFSNVSSLRCIRDIGNLFRRPDAAASFGRWYQASRESARSRQLEPAFAPAASACAFDMVLSINTYSKSGSSASLVKSLSPDAREPPSLEAGNEPSPTSLIRAADHAGAPHHRPSTKSHRRKACCRRRFNPGPALRPGRCSSIRSHCLSASVPSAQNRLLQRPWIRSMPSTQIPACRRNLDRDPSKWVRVFEKDHAQQKT